jgi:hypothetical protein
MKPARNEGSRKPRRIRSLLLVGIVLSFLVLILVSCQLPFKLPFKLPFAQSGDSTPLAATLTPSPYRTATCPSNMQLSTPIGVNISTTLYIFVYDPSSKVVPSLDLPDGTKISDTSKFVSDIIPDFLKPGDEISVFRIGFDSYTAGRVTRQYSYLTSFPQLYVAPTYITLTPLPPTSIPTPGFSEVATKNAARGVATERAATEAAYKASYDCEVAYYDINVKATATAWDQMQKEDVSTIHNAAAADFGTITPGRGKSEELMYGGWYYGLYFASLDFKSDCAKYDKCILVLVGGLNVYRKNNPDNLPISLNGIDTYVILSGCRDLNQPDCAETQTYWTSELQRLGAPNTVFMNGVRAGTNLITDIRR